MSATHALIIDDDAKNLNVLARLLWEEGVSSTQVINPKHLNTVLDTSDHVDLVFLDLEMPGLNGYQVFDQLKSDQRLGYIPIVAYTVHANEMNKAFSLGFHSFLSKPLDSDKFPQQLARILRGESVWENS